MISIVIATYNAENFLQDCIRSILPQKDDSLELIIIDGNSTDRTLEIIRANEEYIEFWLSETDRGIYDAWNKGVSKASGEWIMFLGADDKLMPEAIKQYTAFLKANKSRNFDIITSRIQMIDLSDNKIRTIGYPYRWPDFLTNMIVAHPGALHSRKLFDKHGYFDTSYKIVGDYEFLLRAGPNLNAGFVNEITVVMREGGASDSLKAIWEAQKAIKNSGYRNDLSSLTNSLWISFKYVSKKIARKFGFNIYIKK